MRALDDVGNVYRTNARDDHRYAAGGRLLDDLRHRVPLRRGRKAASRRRRRTASVQRYRWDTLGRLSRWRSRTPRRVAFDYDALGRRVARRLEKKTIDPRARRAGLGRGAGHALRLGRARAAARGRGRPRHELDLGERARSSASSTTTARTRCSPIRSGRRPSSRRSGATWSGRVSIDVFGALQRENEQHACPWRFPGHYEDPDTGLQHSWLRVYDPETGTYLTPNPLGVVAGTNLYGYLPDPMSHDEPARARVADTRRSVGSCDRSGSRRS